MINNISKFTSVDNTHWPAGPPVRAAAATGAPARTGPQARTAAGGRFNDGRAGRRERVPTLAGRLLGAAARILVLAGRVLVSWLAAIPRRLGDRLFVMNDTEAYWRSWQITRTHGGLGRRYRDPRFDTLAECPKCHGTGRTQGYPGRTQGYPGRTQGYPASRAADLPCAPCLGTGRITLGEVS